MKIEVVNSPLSFNLHGFSGIAVGKDYAGTAFRLMDKMWQVVKSNSLKSKGQNIWVYESNESVFAGVELDDSSQPNTGLEQKIFTIKKYACYKHVGPYHLIKHVGQEMNDELKKKGFNTTLPYVEVYGHWSNDESKLETELIMSIEAE